MKFKNLTPHAVVVKNGSLKVTFEKDPKDPVARIEQNIIETSVDYEVLPGMKMSFPLAAHTSFKVVNLPAPEPGVMYIVSSMVASRVHRADVISPITDVTCERDKDGRVISVRGFQTFTPDYNQKKPVMEELPKEEMEEAIQEAAVAVEEVTQEDTASPSDEYEHITSEEELYPIEITLDAMAGMVDPEKEKRRLKYEKRMAKLRK